MPYTHPNARGGQENEESDGTNPLGPTPAGFTPQPAPTYGTSLLLPPCCLHMYIKFVCAQGRAHEAPVAPPMPSENLTRTSLQSCQERKRSSRFPRRPSIWTTTYVFHGSRPQTRPETPVSPKRRPLLPDSLSSIRPAYYALTLPFVRPFVRSHSETC